MRTARYLLAAIIVAGASRCASQRPSHQTNTTEDSAAIRRVLDERRATLESGNAAGWLAVWTDDVRIIDPAGSDIVGREALRSWAEPFFAQLRMQYTESVEEILASGNWAFVRVGYDFRFTPKAGGATTQDRGKGLLLLRKDAAGSWRIAHLLFAPSPAQAPAR